MNILDRVARLKQAELATRADKDLAAWRAWKTSPTDANLSALLKQMDPMIQSEVNRWGGVLARPVLETEGRKLAVDAFRTYEANRGAALATHVANSLKKLSRLAYTHQSLARVPENKRLQYHSVELASTHLADQLGRPPSHEELADHLGWSLKYLNQFKTEAARKEYVESGPVIPNLQTEEHDDTVDLVHHDLTHVQKQIMEHLTGFRGAPVLGNVEIMKKLNLTQGQYSYQKRLIEQAFVKAGK